ncbi:MAG TPA: lysophospholipid acyltransferase family protein [Candidatus Binatia bacterium]|nr:lysophospholipid acyltransferase family protein [Candidatus Binatia bacterium]
MNSPSLAPQKSHLHESGMDRDFIDRWGKTLFHFLCKYYWRIETTGLEHVPSHGGAVLVGTHRGFMPWDAVMTLHLIVQSTGRVPRFLCHPGLLKFHVIANCITRLGGVLACRENADRVLAADELLGVLPEGVEGAFSLYRNAYKLSSFGRDDFVKMALRHRVPIVPFVIVGNAEILPMFSRIKSRWWTKHLDWPYVPISTFPIIPVPLPSKWHVRFLAPINAHEHYSPDAARDRSAVKAISLKVRTTMQDSLDEMVARRRSIFFGSIF